MMSNWMGFSGATRASSESTESAGDGSEPTELMLPARPTRPLLEKTRREEKVGVSVVSLTEEETNSHVERFQKTNLLGLMLSCLCWKDGDGVTASSAD